MHTARRFLPTALAAAAVFSAVVAGPAAADTGNSGARSIVHETPKVPVIVDGTRYAPKQIHRFDGRPLYMRLTANRKALVAYTKRADFDAALRRMARRTAGKARTSGRGAYVRFFKDYGLRGDWHYVDSGRGIANLDCLEWTVFGNDISSLYVNGQNIVIYDQPDFNYHTWGDALALSPGYYDDLRLYGFDNRIESLFMFW